MNLRLKIVAVIMVTCAALAVVFGAIWYPFEMTRRSAQNQKIRLMLVSLYHQKNEKIADEIYSGQSRTITKSIQGFKKIEGIIGVSVYGLDGLLLASTSDISARTIPPSEKKIMNHGPVFATISGPKGPLLVFSAKVETLGVQAGYLKIYYDLSGVERETITTIILFVLLLLATMGIISGLLSFLLFRLVIKPVSLLRSAMRRVEAGELGLQVSIDSLDEIGEMADAFNEMSVRLKEQRRAFVEAVADKELAAEQLEASFTELERLNSDLEHMVDERTVELTESISQLQEEVRQRVRTQADLAAEKERLAVTLSSIGDGIITTDTRGHVELINQNARDITGWSAFSAVNQPVDQVFVLKKNPGGEHPVYQALNTGTLVAPQKPVTLVNRDGRDIVIHFSVAPIMGRKTMALGTVLIFKDLTVQKKMEAAAQQSAKLESLGVLAGGIAHDFNNILTAILGNIELARLYSSPDGKCRSKLFEAEKAIIHAQGLTRQLLTFSKGGIPIKSPTSIRELLMDTATFALSGANVSCEFDLDGDLWPLNADSTQIGQVLNNLILNAVQAMPDGGTIKVGAHNRVVPQEDRLGVVQAGRYVVVTVKDQGHGIPREARSKIFDPYFTTKEHGSGLGLSTSYSIVKNHGGHIDVESKEGQGTTFRAYLPAAETSLNAAQSTEFEIIRGQGRILVMDDEQNILDLSADALEFLGYRSEMAREGREAIEKFTMAVTERDPFDAVIMDLTIPGGMGGKEAIQHLLALNPEVKAIVSSGYSQDPIMSDHQANGFVDILPKPFTLEQLSLVLHRTINGRSRSRP